MKINGNHMIEKLVVDVTTSSTERGHQIRDNVRDFIDRCIVPAIESYVASLEHLLPEGEVLQLDKLTLDISGPVSEWNTGELEQTIRQQFDKALEDNRQTIHSMHAGAAAKKPDSVNSSEAKTINGPDKPVLTLFFKQQLQLDAWLYFLEHGMRPWWAVEAAENPLLQEAELLNVLREHASEVHRDFTGKLTFRKTRQRLIHQFSDEFLLQITPFIANKSFPVSQETKLTGTQLTIRDFVSRFRDIRSRQLFWELILENVSGNWIPSQASDRKLLKRVHEMVQAAGIVSGQPVAPVSVMKLIHQFAGKTAQESYYTDLETEIAALLPTGSSPEEESNGADKSGLTTDKIGFEDDALIQQPEKPETGTGATQLKSVNKTIAPGENSENRSAAATDYSPNPEFGSPAHMRPEPTGMRLIVDNAGLILAHPFLKHLFTRTGLLTENNMLTDRILAAHVLHYVATGREKDYEHTMLFEKYLTGLPVTESIPRDVAISDTIKTEVHGLLEAVKENWAPMNSSSDEALRETFLQRPGKLIDELPHPRVVIERKTLDILLNQLNWTTSIIRLPWMDSLIYVEW